MEFQNFYPYAKNIKQKGFSLNLLSTNSHPTNHQTTIDLLFKELEKSENQPEKFPVFLDRCQSLINHYSKITPIPSSIPITVLSLSAIKLEIYRRQNDHSNLNKEFCFLFWAISCSIKIDNNLLENVGSNLKSSVIQLIQELLPNLRHLPPRITRQKSQLSVPEVLADASYIAGNNYDLNKIRKIFYELWQDEKLRPLLAITAHATQGFYCSESQQAYQDSELKFIFLRPNSSTGNGYIQTYSQNLSTKFIPILLAPNNLEAKFKIEITQKLQQHWRKSFYKSETLKVQNSSEISDQEQQRILESLAIIGDIHDSHISINESFSTVPLHPFYQPNQLYVALTTANNSLVNSLLKSEDFDLESPDNFGASAFGSILEQGEKQLALQFLESRKAQEIVKRNSDLYRQSVLYLVKLIYGQDTETSQQAHKIFTTITSTEDKLFSISKTYTLDPNLADLLITLKSPQNILRAINDGDIPFCDKFGNDFYDYLYDVFDYEERHKIIDKICPHYNIFSKHRSPEFIRIDQNPQNILGIITNLERLYPFIKKHETAQKTESTNFVLPKSLQRPIVSKQYLAEVKDAFDDIFAKIEELKTTNNIAESIKEIFAKCDRIIFGQTLTPNPISPIFILSAMAVKMELALDFDVALIPSSDPKIDANLIVNCGDFSFARMNNKSFLINLQALAKDRSQESSELINKNIFHSFRSIKNRLSNSLITPFKIDKSEETTTYDVPTILTSASLIVQESTLTKINIAKIFYELWEVETLQPLLTNIAYATLGLSLEEEKLQNTTPLKIIFNDHVLSNHKTSSIVLGIKQHSTITIAISKQDEQGIEIQLTSQEIKGTIIHEMHHFWEQLKHCNTSSLPYLETIIRSKFDSSKDPNREIKMRLDQMIQESRMIVKDYSVTILKEFGTSSYKTLREEPFHTFKDLQSYENDQETQHSEIVVRVPEAIAKITANGSTEAEVVEILIKSGAKECVKFFQEEVTQMQNFVQILQKESGIIFTNPQKTKDFFAKNDLERALDLQDTEAVIAICQSETIKELSGDLPLLHRTVSHLIKTAQNPDHINSEEALSKFREIRDQIFFAKDTSRFAFTIMSLNIDLTFDKDLKDQISSRNIAEIVTSIKDGKIPFRDKFGNSFINYTIKTAPGSYERNLYQRLEDFVLYPYSTVSGKYIDRITPFLNKLVREVKKERTFYSQQESDEFLPITPQNLFYQSLFENNPRTFKKILNSAEDPIALLTQEVPSRNKENNCAIEIIAKLLPPLMRKDQKPHLWFTTFKEILQKYSLDPHEKYGNNDKALIDLVHRSLVPEISEIQIKPSNSAVPKNSKLLVNLPKLHSNHL